MPVRLVIPVADHLRRHPYRLVATFVVAFFITWGVAIFAIVQSFDNAREGRIAVCKSVNELRRQIVVAAADLGADPIVIGRLIPTEGCEELP